MMTARLTLSGVRTPTNSSLYLLSRFVSSSSSSSTSLRSPFSTSTSSHFCSSFQRFSFLPSLASSPFDHLSVRNSRASCTTLAGVDLDDEIEDEDDGLEEEGGFEGRVEEPVKLDPEIIHLRDRLSRKKWRANAEAEAISIASASYPPLQDFRDLTIEESLFQHTLEDEMSRAPKKPKASVPAKQETFEFAPRMNLPVGEYFEVHPRIREKFFPGGLAGGMNEEFKAMSRVGFYLRPVARDLFQRFKSYQQNGFPESPLFIAGESGSGKSALLNQLVLWARTNNWIVVFIPNPKIDKLTGYLTPSRVHIGCYDQPVHSRALCYNLLVTHGEKLKKLKIRRGPFMIGNYIFSPNDNKTLFDILKFGAQKIFHSAEALHHFMRELHLVTEYPVLLAYDAVDATFSPSGFYDPHSTKFRPDLLTCEKLSMTKEFMHLKSNPMLNGAVVYTLSPDKRAKLPSSFLSPSSVITLPKWTKSDFVNQMSFYQNIGWVETLPPLSIEYLYTLTNGLPTEAWKITKHTELGDPGKIIGVDTSRLTEKVLADMGAKLGLDPNDSKKLGELLPEPIKETFLQTMSPDFEEETFLEDEDEAFQELEGSRS